MVKFTDRAREMVKTFAEYTDDPVLRIRVAGSPLSPEYEFALVDEEPAEGDEVVVEQGFRVLIDAESGRKLNGATVEWTETPHGAGFEVQNPNVRGLGQVEPSGPLAERVKQVLAERVNPAVASHGGHIGLVDIEDNVVYIEMSGGCQGCGLAAVTLQKGVERMLREAIPEIAGVVDATDHARGENPYYTETHA